MVLLMRGNIETETMLLLGMAQQSKLVQQQPMLSQVVVPSMMSQPVSVVLSSVV